MTTNHKFVYWLKNFPGYSEPSAVKRGFRGGLFVSRTKLSPHYDSPIFQKILDSLPLKELARNLTGDLESDYETVYRKLMPNLTPRQTARIRAHAREKGLDTDLAEILLIPSILRLAA